MNFVSGDRSHSTGVRPNPAIHGKDPAGAPGIDGSYPLLCHLLDTAVVAEHLWNTRVRPKLKATIASVLNVSEDEAGRVLMLIAALHDLGKVNPFFQYQERLGSPAFVPELEAALDLPTTESMLCSLMRSQTSHPLRRHEFLSHRAITGQWPSGLDKLRGAAWSGLVAGGHHGYWRDTSINDLPIGADGETLIRGWTGQQEALLSLIEGAIGIQVADVPTLDGPRAMIPFVCFSGLLTMADWIASDDSKVGEGKRLWTQRSGTPRDPHESPTSAQDWMRHRGVALCAHTDSGLGDTSSVTRQSLNEAAMEGFDPRPLQKEALDLADHDDPGLWICMYPTGDGKTEAALLRGAVDVGEGFFFALPTLATTDAMEARIATLTGRLDPSEDLPLIKSHQFARSMRTERPPQAGDQSDDECCDQSNPTWYTASIRKLVAPNVVGTVDQALVGALGQRHLTLRLFGLANHHMILDEVHTYDAYQTELLIELLYWWGLTGTRVTLLSATLPASHMKCMVQSYAAGITAAPFMSLADQADEVTAQFPATVSVSLDGSISHQPGPTDGSIRRPQPTHIELPAGVRSRADRIASHVAWAKDTASAHPRSPIAIVSNVVADCAAIATTLLADPEVTATHEVLSLHSSFTAEHRRKVEQRLIERAGRRAHAAGFNEGRKPVIIVGTQVIQASLDFDVDFMASDLAPAPDLLQRLGRAWRFEGSDDIAEFRGGRLPADAKRTFRVLAVLDEADVPSDRGSVPYLTAPLRRTYATLVQRVREGPLVDVFSFSQQWVDAAYDKDPYTLLSEDRDELRSATTEIADESAKRLAAGDSRAALARSRRDGLAPLLPAPKGLSNKGPRWQNLVELTKTSDDEDLMRTRYIEHESMAVILFDSTGESFYTDPTTGAAIFFPSDLSVHDMHELEVRDALHLIERWYCVIGWSLRRTAEEAVKLTLAPLRGEWKPQSKLLASTCPLDLKQLRDAAEYHPTVGLMMKKDT